jgi:2-dehydropantoate 2-reductase
MTSLAILGPGGVGGFIAAALARTGHDVTVVAREPAAELINRDGLAVESVLLGDFQARPRGVARLRAAVDVLFLATKATGLEAALERIEAVPGLIVPLLNGLDHLPLLRRRFPAERVAAGTIRIEADRPQPGRIVHTSRFLRVDLAADDPALHSALARLALTLRQAEIPARLGASEAEILWSKLVRLNALACTTSASGERLGFIRADPTWRAALEGAVAEGAAVARAEGAELDAAGPMAELEDAHAELGSSMQRDIAAGREPELDAIAGSVLRAGRRHGIDCPTITRLAAEVARRAGIPPPRV